MTALVSRRDADVFLVLLERQARIRMKRATLGMVWPLVAPLFLLALYAFVFQGVFDVPIPRYADFLFAGLLPWSFLAMSLGQTLPSLSVEAELLRKAPFRYELLPVSNVAVNYAYFLVTLTGFVAYLAVRGRLEWPVLPVVLLPTLALFLLVSSVSMWLSLIDVYNRDLRQILGNLLTIWFFLVPIVYRHEMVPARVRFLRSVDPMNMIVGQFRDVLYYGHISHAPHLVLMLVVCSVFFAVTVAGFRRLAADLPKDV